MVACAAGTKAPAPRTLGTIRARGPLVEQVYRSLKDAIITGRIAPGAWLYETALTQALGVSRTPLREAFNRLKGDGLIAVIPHRGAFVVELDDRDIDNLLEAREVIETAFFERAAQVLTADGRRAATGPPRVRAGAPSLRRREGCGRPAQGVAAVPAHRP